MHVHVHAQLCQEFAGPTPEEHANVILSGSVVASGFGSNVKVLRDFHSSNSGESIVVLF